MRWCAVVAAGLITQSAVAGACPPDAKARLDAEHHRARRWDLSWAGTFGVLTVAQLAAAEARWTPIGPFDDDVKHGLWVNAGESAFGMIAHLVMPLRVVVDGEPCHALEVTAHHEKVAFWLNHLGGLAVGLGGMVLLGTVFDSWKQGAMSFALGYPVSLLATYTMPRHVWHLVRGPDYTGAAVSGTF